MTTIHDPSGLRKSLSRSELRGHLASLEVTFAATQQRAQVRNFHSSAILTGTACEEGGTALLLSIRSTKLTLCPRPAVQALMRLSLVSPTGRGMASRIRASASSPLPIRPSSSSSWSPDGCVNLGSPEPGATGLCSTAATPSTAFAPTRLAFDQLPPQAPGNFPGTGSFARKSVESAFSSQGPEGKEPKSDCGATALRRENAGVSAPPRALEAAAADVPGTALQRLKAARLRAGAAARVRGVEVADEGPVQQPVSVDKPAARLPARNAPLHARTDSTSTVAATPAGSVRPQPGQPAATPVAPTQAGARGGAGSSAARPFLKRRSQAHPMHQRPDWSAVKPRTQSRLDANFVPRKPVAGAQRPAGSSNAARVRHPSAAAPSSNNKAAQGRRVPTDPSRPRPARNTRPAADAWAGGSAMQRGHPRSARTNPFSAHLAGEYDAAPLAKDVATQLGGRAEANGQDLQDPLGPLLVQLDQMLSSVGKAVRDCRR